MARPMVRGLSPAPFVALAAFAAVGIMRWPLPWVLVVMAPVSIALAWWERR
jgi:chromate transporter